MSDLLDAETKALESPDHHIDEVRLWLRLLTCSTLVADTIRRNLAAEFDMTLPRFDFLAQLDRIGRGMTLGEVSRRMMTSPGNVTLLAERLERDGLIVRAVDPADRRSALVELSPTGRALFSRAAAAHAGWLSALFADLQEAEMVRLMTLLGQVKASVLRA